MVYGWLVALGTMLTAIGVSRRIFSSPVLRIALAVCGPSLIGYAVTRVGYTGTSQVVEFFSYMGAAGGLGSSIDLLFAPKHKGAIVTLGSAATTGFKVISFIVVPTCIAIIVTNSLEGRRSVGSRYLIAQIAFFSAAGLDSVLMWRARWTLSDDGIVGPYRVVPWAEVESWKWEDPTRLCLALTSARSRTSYQMRIPVPADVHDRAEAFLVHKIPSANASPLQ
jgi:hypothetical protein